MAPPQGPPPSRPERQVQHAGDLGDPGAPVHWPSVSKGGPGTGGDLEDGVLDIFGDGEPGRIGKTAAWPGEPVQELMGTAAGVTADQHPPLQVTGQLRHPSRAASM